MTDNTLTTNILIKLKSTSKQTTAILRPASGSSRKKEGWFLDLFKNQSPKKNLYTTNNHLIKTLSRVNQDFRLPVLDVGGVEGFEAVAYLHHHHGGVEGCVVHMLAVFMLHDVTIEVVAGGGVAVPGEGAAAQHHEVGPHGDGLLEEEADAQGVGEGGGVAVGADVEVVVFGVLHLLDGGPFVAGVEVLPVGDEAQVEAGEGFAIEVDAAHGVAVAEPQLEGDMAEVRQLHEVVAALAVAVLVDDVVVFAHIAADAALEVVALKGHLQAGEGGDGVAEVEAGAPSPARPCLELVPFGEHPLVVAHAGVGVEALREGDAPLKADIELCPEFLAPQGQEQQNKS